MSVATVEDAKARLGRLKRRRNTTREKLEDLEAERRQLLRFCVEHGISQAELARWEGVSDWAIALAIRKA